MSTHDIRKQLEVFKETLRQGKWAKDSDVYKKSVKFLRGLPPGAVTPRERAECQRLMQRAFNVSEEFQTSKPEGPFDDLVPSTGWFKDYHEFTLSSEPPAVFHFASALTVLGAALGRKVYFDKGFYRVYPNIATVLIAPTGRCRKTSACNIALQLAREVGVNTLTDRVTPEALVEALYQRTPAVGLVYAPELAVFLGRQRYLEGMVPLLTSLFDAPDVWSSTTIGRGEVTLTNVALSFLGATTLEWFIEALPAQVFSGGFMSRILFIVQESTDREFALPKRSAGHLFERLRETLQELVEIEGEVILVRGAHKWYEDWYSEHHHQEIRDEKFAGYHERKPDHLLRVALLLRIAAEQSLQITPDAFEEALRILNWTERLLPDVFRTVAATEQGSRQQKILDILHKNGGKLAHSILLRKVQHIMNARTFFESMQTLTESGLVEEINTPVEHAYALEGYVDEEDT